MRAIKVLHITIFALVLISTCLAIWIHFLNEGKDLLNFTISMVGFCVAVLALFISVQTYTAIDSVNNISKMDGNILDNEHYVTSLPELINRYNSADEKALSEEIFKSIEYKVKRESNTAVQLADTLQFMIDLIVLFPAVFNACDTDKKSYKNRMDKILSNVDKNRDFILTVSKGNSIQISETIKLFKAVVAYQNLVSLGNFNIHADLLHVRGPILRNPVTKTIYHNYLGLYYNKKAAHLLRTALSLNSSDIHSIDTLKEIKDGVRSISPSIAEDISMYLGTACDQFDKALSASSEDVMWPGFINYNKARSQYFLNYFVEPKKDWAVLMDAAIESRSRLNRLANETLSIDSGSATNTTNTHLQTFFLQEEELARMVKINFLLCENIQNVNAFPILYKGTNILVTPIDLVQSLFFKAEKFPAVKLHQDKIIGFLRSTRATPSSL